MCYYKLGQLGYYKSGQELLQIGAGITNRGKSYYKLGQVLQIGAELLQIGAGITNRGNYYKSVQNSLFVDMNMKQYSFINHRGVREMLSH